MQLIDYISPFLEASAHNGNSAGELSQKRMALANHLGPELGHLALDAIGQREARTYIAKKRKSGLAPKTINNHLAVLHRMLAQAREDGLASGPLVRFISLPTPVEEAKYLSRGEIKSLLIAADRSRQGAYRQLLVLALNTGMRISELLALDWRDISLGESGYRLRVRASICRETGKRKLPKNNKYRDIPLNEAARGVLHAMGPKASGQLFSLDYDSARMGLNRICKRAGLPQIGWHTLRHTFASQLVLKGIPLFVVSRLLGHSSLQMTERYAHLNDEHGRVAVDVLDGEG